MKIVKLKNTMTSEESEALKGTYLDESHFDHLIQEDCDGYDDRGNMLFKFRKNAIPFDVLKNGYESFKKSIGSTDGRGTASGNTFKRIRKDGTVSKISIGNKVESGNVGFMDTNAMIHYCRRTGFARRYFDKFKEGIPFVEHIDRLYEELCPEHYARQKAIAKATDKNYVIGDTSFTTVTVNRNFRTAVHQDSGDLPDGFGNLIVYREKHFDGGYFCLPEYRAAIDMQNTDILFVDVHKWHGNTPFYNCDEDYLRISFVLYYREYMIKCKNPTEELLRVKMDRTGYYSL